MNGNNPATVGFRFFSVAANLSIAEYRCEWRFCAGQETLAPPTDEALALLPDEPPYFPAVVYAIRFLETCYLRWLAYCYWICRAPGGQDVLAAEAHSLTIDPARWQAAIVQLP